MDENRWNSAKWTPLESTVTKYFENIQKKIENVNAESVKKIAQLIVSRPLTISSIGPIKKLETLDKIQDKCH